MTPTDTVPVSAPTTVAVLTTGSTIGTLRACVALIGGELFAIDLKYVREVFPVDHLTPVPKMPAVIVGVANLRGTIMPLVDLRAVLNHNDVNGAQPFAIVVSHGTQQVGLLLDQVPEIRSLVKSDLLAPPSSQESAARPFLSAMVPLDGRMAGMVDVPTLLAKVEAS
ncbi:MAG: chemotaxis protein CheW [Nitrospiraceae bacterium]